MTDIVEELAKFICEEDWDELFPMNKAMYQAQAKDILSFLQPHIIEKKREAFQAGKERGVREIIDLNYTFDCSCTEPDFDEWLAAQK